MDLSVITVTWNSKGVIGEQVRSVQAGSKNISYEQIIVDNASSDGTGDYIYNEFPEIRLIQNRKNSGFGQANNKAAAESQGEFLLFLNPDMRVQEGSLQPMVAWMRAHPEVGLASCLLTTPDGQPHPEAQPRRFPGFLDQVAIMLKIRKLFPQALNRYLFRDFDPSKEQMVDTVRGSFMMMRCDVYQKLGWAFDPRYYIWFEDVDTCRETWRLGYTIMHTPIISCVDQLGHSFSQRDAFWKHRHYTKSMVTYFKKWEPMSVWLPLWLVRLASLFPARLYSLIK